MQYSVEIRRLQITGGSSFMITLPKGWIIARGLAKNDPITVTPQSDGGLLLTTGSYSGQDSSKTVLVDDFRTPGALYRGLIGAYIAGHDQIVIESAGPIPGAYLEIISEFTQTSMGMEIVEEEEDRIVIKDLINHSEVIPQKNVKREYLLVKRMISDAMSGDPPAVSEMESRDTEVDRIHWLVQRQASIHQQDIGLSSKMGLQLRTVTSCVGVSRMLERMGDHAVLLARYMGSLSEQERGSIMHSMFSVGNSLLHYLEGSMHAWLDADIGLAEEALCRKSGMLEEILHAFSGCQEMTNAGMIRGSLTRIVEYCTDVSESAINISMECP